MRLAIRAAESEGPLAGRTLREQGEREWGCVEPCLGQRAELAWCERLVWEGWGGEAPPLHVVESADEPSLKDAAAAKLQGVSGVDAAFLDKGEERRITVAGLTKASGERQPCQTRDRATQKALSWGLSRGRLCVRAYVAVFLGMWATEKDAAKAVDRAALHYHGPDCRLNSPRRRPRLQPADATTLVAEARPEFKQTTTSRYLGVSWQQGAWTAIIEHRGHARYLARFVVEEDAARAWDRESLKLRGARARLNFHPETGEEIGGRRLCEVESAEAARR